MEKRLEKKSLPAKQYNGLWLEFEDESGFGFCQPDVVLVGEDRVVVVECKLTQTDQAEDQLELLYMPIVRLLFGLPVFGVQICRNQYQRPRNPIRRIETLFEEDLLDLDTINTLHWTI